MRLRLAYLLVYVLILSAVFFVPAWRSLDWKLFSTLHQSTAPQWSEELAIIDVPYLNDRGQFSLVDFRSRIGALMSHLADGAQGRPQAVLLDIAFGREVEGIEHVTSGLEKLAKAGVKRYAAIDLSAKRPFAGTVDSLSAPLRYVDGVAHTQFQQRSGVLVYASELHRTDGTVISAMPIRVAKDLFGRPEAATEETITVRIGPKDAHLLHTLKWQRRADKQQRLSPLVESVPASIDKHLVIVGSLDEDSNRFAGRSGPELLAWALLARMARTDAAVGPRPLDSPVLFAGLLIVLPAGSVFAFRVLRSWLGGQRRRTWSAAAAILLGLCCLVILVAALFALGRLYTQVTLVFIGIVVSVALAGFSVFHRELLASLEADLESGKLQTAETYDVFISYSREASNAKWVEEHVYKPLLAARRADGTPLNIFFDTRNIRVGDFWYRRLALAVAASRYFVPVYSDDYFDKAFCVHELTLALARSAQKAQFILPLLRTAKPIPPGYDHIQHIDVATQPQFIEEVVAWCLQ